MQAFSYSARDTTTNKVVHSTVEAESERLAAKLLMGQGLIPLSIKEHSKDGTIIDKLQSRIGTKDRVIFTRQLATLINAGLPLAQSLHTVAEQTANKKLKSVVLDIITSIEGGSSLADAFGKHSEAFNELFVALIASGEASGTLDKALERVANQQEKDAETMSRVKGALVYPVIVLFVIIGVIVFMLVSVVPQIEKLYDDLKQELPFVTAIMVQAASFVTHFWWALIIGTVVGIYFLRRYFATEDGKHIADVMKLNAPLFGDMFKKLYMARFARTGETLLSTGVPMLEMMSISARSVGNSVIANSINKAAEKVKGGKALSVTLKGDPHILPLIPQMISIGEQSGGIDTMMGKAASFYETELDNTIKSISTAIEPILMVVMALVAGVMVAAILLPVYGLINTGALGN